MRKVPLLLLAILCVGCSMAKKPCNIPSSTCLDNEICVLGSCRLPCGGSLLCNPITSRCTAGGVCEKIKAGDECGKAPCRTSQVCRSDQCWIQCGLNLCNPTFEECNAKQFCAAKSSSGNRVG
uniref:Uncharacterized protein n=1 Tax=Plectus sambesii TaxID=2011161 RepID=A0A914VMD4_9BILA